MNETHASFNKERFNTFVALVPKSEWSLSTCRENLAVAWSYNEMKELMPKGSLLITPHAFEKILNDPERSIRCFNVRFVEIWMTPNEYLFNYNN